MYVYHYCAFYQRASDYATIHLDGIASSDKEILTMKDYAVFKDTLCPDHHTTLITLTLLKAT